MSRPIVNPALFPENSNDLVRECFSGGLKSRLTGEYCLPCKSRIKGFQGAEQVFDGHFGDFLKAIAIDLKALKIGPTFILVNEKERSDVLEIQFARIASAGHHGGSGQINPFEQKVLEAPMFIFHGLLPRKEPTRSDHAARFCDLFDDHLRGIPLYLAPKLDASAVVTRKG